MGQCARAWADLHPKQQNHPGRGAKKTRPVVCGTLILVEVSRLPGPRRPWHLLWLWWSGPGTPDLDVCAPGVHPSVRRGAYVQISQTGAELDAPPGASPGAGRSLDVACAGRLHPTAPCDRLCAGPALALGTSPAGAHPLALPRPPRLFRTLAARGDAGKRAKTLWPLARAVQRPSVHAGTASSRGQTVVKTTPPGRPRAKKRHPTRVVAAAKSA